MIPAQATIAYSNLGPGDSFDGTKGWLVGTAPSTVQTPVMPFTVGASGVLDKIRVAIQGLDPGATFNAILDADSGANTIGANMVSWGFTGPASA